MKIMFEEKSFKDMFFETDIDKQPEDKTVYHNVKTNIKTLDGRLKETKFLLLENAKRESENIISSNINARVRIETYEDNMLLTTLYFDGLEWKTALNEEYKVNNYFKDDKAEYLNRFLAFAKDYLKINTLPEIQFLDSRQEGMTAGYYDPQNNKVGTLAGKRAFADVLRSLAHELVHHSQNEKGQLVGDIPYAGGVIEDEANAVAGQIVKLFGKNPDNKVIYEL